MYRDRINIKLVLLVWLVTGILILLNIKNVEAATSSNRNIQITREIILSGVEDFEGLENEINNIQGVIILQNSGTSTNSQYSLLIPRENFDKNLEAIVQFGTVKSDSRTQSDITSEVTILEKSIISNEEHKNVIMNMIEKAKTIDSILEFEQYLMNVEIEKTNNENQLQGLTNLSNYTTLNLSIEKSEEIKTMLEDSFSEKLGDAFSDSIKNTKTFFEYVVIAISYVLLPLVFVTIIALIVIKLRKRGKDNEEK